MLYLVTRYTALGDANLGLAIKLVCSTAILDMRNKADVIEKRETSIPNGYKSCYI